VADQVAHNRLQKTSALPMKHASQQAFGSRDLGAEYFA
jgi:hypothetical protein